MLGETVLQMVIADIGDQNSVFSAQMFSRSHFAILASLAIAWTMMLSFRHMVGEQLAAFEKINDQVHTPTLVG